MSEIDDFFKDEEQKSLYTKLTEGTTKLRILTPFTIGWEGWYQNKPVRFAADYQMPSEERNSLDTNSDNYPKYKQFMACVVWNYDLEALQYWQITQATIRKPLLALDKDPDWGGLSTHDIKIVREGKELNTSYTVTPAPGVLPEDVKTKLEESGMDPKHLLTDTKNAENVENFRKSVGKGETGEEEEIKPEDIPF
jgi:hypothetical protein